MTGASVAQGRCGWPHKRLCYTGGMPLLRPFSVVFPGPAPLPAGLVPARALPVTATRVLPVLLAVLCGCPTQQPTPTRTIRGTLQFLDPRDGDVLTRTSDLDPDEPGLQHAVDLRALGLAQGTPVTLRVDTVVGPDQVAPVRAGTAIFRVTLPFTGAPEGTVHRLVASAPGADPATVLVRTVEDRQPRCTLDGLPDGIVVRTPAQPTGGVQRDILVRCPEGDTLTVGQAASLQVRVGPGDGAPVLEAQGSFGPDRVAAFTGVQLPEGLVQLRTLTRGVDGSRVGLLTVGLSVDTGRCDVWTVPGRPEGVLNAQNATDLRPQTPALDVGVEVGSSRCVNGRASVLVDGVPVATTGLNRGLGTAVAALSPGTHTLAVGVQRADDTGLALSLPWQVRVDNAVPCPRWASPTQDALLGAAADEEQPPDAANGTTLTARGLLVGGAAPGTELTLTARGPSGAERTLGGVVPSEAGAFAFPLVDLADGRWELSAVARDAAGNRCPAPGAPAVTRRFRVGVPVEQQLGVVLLGDNDPPDGTLNGREDADTQRAGVQAAFRVVTQDALLAGARAWVSAVPVDAQGQPVGGASFQASAVVDAEGNARVVLDVPEGLSSISAWVARPDGTDGRRVDDALPLAVDGVAPNPLLLHPDNGSELGGASVDVQVLLLEPDARPLLTTLEVNGVASTVMPTLGVQGVLAFPEVSLRGAADGRYRLVVRIPDAAGNVAELESTVRVVLRAPVPTLTGVDANGAPRALAPAAESGPQPRTPLDIRTAEDLLTLDYNNNRADGLQYGFAVELSLEDCMNVDALRALVRVRGLADDLEVALQPAGSVCRGVVGAPGVGITLPEGDGDALVVVRDAAGNVGARRYFFNVRRQEAFVRVDAPANGARVGGAPLNVVATTDLLGSGSCQLWVDGVESGAPVPLGAVMTLGPATPPQGDGARSTLDVRCTVENVEQRSLPITVERDDQAPAGTQLVLAGGAGLPLTFNALVPTDGPRAHPRFLKDLAVEANAEAGGCSRMGTALLTVQRQDEAAVPYAARITAAGVWVYIPAAGQDRCRAVFPLVDLGAALEPGTQHTLRATVSDSAGNPAAAPVAIRLTDRVPPTVTRVAPTRRAFRPQDDAFPATPGVQVPLSVGVVPDGRPATVTLQCLGALSCSAPQATTTDAAPVAFALADVAPAFLMETADGVGAWRITATDAALNVTVLEEPVWLSTGSAAVALTTPQDTVLNAASDQDPEAAGWQGTVSAEVTGCGVPGVPGAVEFVVEGTAAAARVTVEADGEVTARVSLPQGPARTITATCLAPTGAEQMDARTWRVDVIPPAQPAPTVMVPEGRSLGVSVSWVAPGDDDTTGTLPAEAYDVVFSTAGPITLSNLHNATRAVISGLTAAPPGGTITVLAQLSGVVSAVHVAVVVTDAGFNKVVGSAPVLPLNWGALRSFITLPAGAVVAPTAGRLNADTSLDLMFGFPTLDGVSLVYTNAAQVAAAGVSQQLVLRAGPMDSACGTSVAILPDLNLDGVAEVWTACSPALGSAFLWLGRVAVPSVAPLPDLEVRRTETPPTGPAEGPALGQQVASGDFDGDGFPDLVLTSSNASGASAVPELWLVFGNGALSGFATSPGTLVLSTALGSGIASRVTGTAGSQLGAALAVVTGFPTGDALVVGSPGADMAAGAVHVLPPGNHLRNLDTTLQALEAQQLARPIRGTQPGDALGSALTAVAVGVAALDHAGTSLRRVDLSNPDQPIPAGQQALLAVATRLASGALLSATPLDVLAVGNASVELVTPVTQVLLPEVEPGVQVVTGDLNADGRTDVLVCNPGERIQYYR